MEVKVQFYSQTVEEIFSELDSDRDGLSAGEVEKRLEKHGENRLETEESVSPLKIFLNQLN